MNDELNYVIESSFGTIGATKRGTKEFCLVSWNDRPAMYDLRLWNFEGNPWKGISLTAEECRKLRDILNSLDLGGD